ncbi:hypothetical protein M0812_20425 [Anaeramoeba flamelloides]|uniref:Uncharacterized protein n=1 Tax=Anaeramoeba flamelloides TaxID=1746091 RepID=A0AAV7YNZ8_9EUKA|nr:hypothetical protein M0812_20425 [Anaeramoeba flamelloides]
MDFIGHETNTNFSDFFQNTQYNDFLNSFDEECFDQKFSNDFLSEDLFNDFETEFNGSLTSSFNGKVENNLKGNNQNSNQQYEYEEEEEDIELEQSQLIQARLENFQLKQSLEELQDEIQMTKFELEKESVLMKQTKKKFHNAQTLYNNLMKQQQLRNYRLQTEPQQKKKKSNIYKKKQNDPTHARNNKKKHTKKCNQKKHSQQKNKNESTVHKHKRKTKKPQQKFLDKSNFNIFVSQLKNLQQATVGEN